MLTARMCNFWPGNVSMRSKRDGSHAEERVRRCTLVISLLDATFTRHTLADVVGRIIHCAH